MYFIRFSSQKISLLLLPYFFLFCGRCAHTRSHSSSQFNFTALDWSQMTKKECLRFGGSLVGKSCKYVPDLAMLSFILFFGTYSMTISLKKFKSSRYFPTKVGTLSWAFSHVFPMYVNMPASVFSGSDRMETVFSYPNPYCIDLSLFPNLLLFFSKCRALIADFSIIISILVFCAVDYVLSLDTPKLHVPTQIKVYNVSSWCYTTEMPFMLVIFEWNAAFKSSSCCI